MYELDDATAEHALAAAARRGVNVRVILDRRHKSLNSAAYRYLTSHRVRVFDADFSHKPVRPGDGRDLVWSPTDSQRQILGLINGARKSLRVYSEEMADLAVDDALIRAARRGVDVSICGENTGGQYDAVFARLARAGVHISYYSSLRGFYIHAKVVEADFGTDHGRSFIGSENFSETSLDRNRELGLITSDRAILASIARTFAGDFKRGKHVR